MSPRGYGARRRAALKNPRWEGGAMAKLKDFALGLVLLAIGVAAFFQVFHVSPFWRSASIGALSALSILAAAVFFVVAFSPRR